jgi:hypothetical protein
MKVSAEMKVAQQIDPMSPSINADLNLPFSSVAGMTNLPLWLEKT